MALPKNDQVISAGTRNRYLQSLQGQLHGLRLAMEKSDLTSVREICHRMRGSAGLFGLKDLGDACRATEEACLARNQEKIVEGFQVIEVIVSRNLADLATPA